ncbi:ABC transporter substrate-binding protein [Alkalihalobacillus sp. AL-G]|uniref:ABC transporter substrate-binding protein n=1 Tax=Alkalihalobacillus sp. AL-G TaxID=2926399 RepID=UPI002729E282|nr:ABC transporter substrate-binding protein [Alkalihalobacillus sp. AL-G]WLD94732.1 ABC transporter substrate-binding protein [Alkalihalobacillus sp. AL-G]
MKDLSYFQMRAFLYPREHDNQVELKLSELEQVWFCTLKNVKRKLRKYEEAGFYTYNPGKGRGNPSKLLFRRSFQHEIEGAVDEYIRYDQMEALMQLLQLPIPKSWIANVSEDVQALFGLQSPNSTKDVLRSIITRPLTTLDPAFTSITFESYLLQQLGDPLVRYDQIKDTVKPHLAHHWTVENNEKTWTFYIRKGVRFHHQRVLTSEDVRHTFQRIQDASPHKWLLKDVSKMECPAPNMIRFELDEPNPFFLRNVSCQNLAILPADVPFDEMQWIGTGPFRLKERSKSKFVLEAFDQYFLERPLLDDIEFWHVPMDHVQAVTFQVDGVEDSEFIQEKEDVEIGFRFLAFNFNRKSIVHHPSFRKAMYQLLNMKKMSYDLGREPLAESSSYFPWKSDAQEKDPSIIHELLNDAGYGGETLTVYSLDFPKPIDETVWFIKQAKIYGISMQHETFPIEGFYSNIIEKNADLVFMGEVASNDHHLSFLGAFYNDALLFRRMLKREHLTTIERHLDFMKREERFSEREQWIERIEEFIRKENLFIYMYHPTKRRTFHPMIKDIRFESFGHVDLRKLWIHT